MLYETSELTKLAASGRVGMWLKISRVRFGKAAEKTRESDILNLIIHRLLWPKEFCNGPWCGCCHVSQDGAASNHSGFLSKYWKHDVLGGQPWSLA